MGELVAIVAILSTVGLPIVTALVIGLNSVRNQHKERMGLINQGIIPPDSPKRKANPNRYVSLRNGIVLVTLGIGILVGFLASENLSIGKDNAFWVIASSVVFFLGIGFLIFFAVTRNMKMDETSFDIAQD